MSLSINSITTLPRGQTYAVRFNEYDPTATLFIYARSADAQATVRNAKIRHGQTTPPTAPDVLGTPVFKGKRVKVDLPVSGDAFDPYLFIDCTSGIIGVEVISRSPFVGQVRG